MKGKVIAVWVIMAIILFTTTGCGKQIQEPGDTIVPPASGTTEEGSGESLKSSGSLNCMSNVSPLAQPSANMVYTLLGKAAAPVSICADNKYLYLLCGQESDAANSDTKNSEMGRLGSIIEVYDVENGSLVRKINSEKIGLCSTFTVKESNLYTFDTETGRISLFSSGGSFLASYETGLGGVYADKIAIAENRYIVLKTRESFGDNQRIAVYNPDTESVERYEASQLYDSPDGEVFEISDFSLFDEKSILVSLSCRRLVLFNMEKSITEKSCAFPMDAGFMEYEGNVLYFAADTPVYLNPGNSANFTNISISRQTGRILINNGFNWPQSEKELAEWILNSLQMPAADGSGRHFGMARNTKYLFFLDFIPAVEKGGRHTETDFMVYRVAK